MRETHRFETLVNYFTSPHEFQIEFMVACMQFINIVVHSVEVSFSFKSTIAELMTRFSGKESLTESTLNRYKFQ